jgi:hypothetical protein
MSKGKGGFKNTKLGKNVYRQLKRRGPLQPIPTRQPNSKQGRPGTAMLPPANVHTGDSGNSSPDSSLGGAATENTEKLPRP